MYLYSPKTLKRIVEGAGFEVELLETSTRSASSSWVSLLEKGLHVCSPDVGEEVFLIGRKTLVDREDCSSSAKQDHSTASCDR